MIKTIKYLNITALLFTSFFAQAMHMGKEVLISAQPTVSTKRKQAIEAVAVKKLKRDINKELKSYLEERVQILNNGILKNKILAYLDNPCICIISDSSYDLDRLLKKTQNKTLAQKLDKFALRFMNEATSLPQSCVGHVGPICGENSEGGQSMIMNDDFTTLVTGSFDTTARVWNLQMGTSKILLGHNAPVTVVALSPDEKSVLTGSGDFSVIYWSLDGSNITVCTGHKSPIVKLNFENNDLFASESLDGAVNKWSIMFGNIFCFKGNGAAEKVNSNLKKINSSSDKSLELKEKQLKELTVKKENAYIIYDLSRYFSCLGISVNPEHSVNLKLWDNSNQFSKNLYVHNALRALREFYIYDNENIKLVRELLNKLKLFVHLREAEFEPKQKTNIKAHFYRFDWLLILGNLLSVIETDIIRQAKTQGEFVINNQNVNSYIEKLQKIRTILINRELKTYFGDSIWYYFMSRYAEVIQHINNKYPTYRNYLTQENQKNLIHEFEIIRKFTEFERIILESERSLMINGIDNNIANSVNLLAKLSNSIEELELKKYLNSRLREFNGLIDRSQAARNNA